MRRTQDPYKGKVINLWWDKKSDKSGNDISTKKAA